MESHVNDFSRKRDRLNLLEKLITNLKVWSRSKICKEIDLQGFKLLEKIENCHFTIDLSNSKASLEAEIIERTHQGRYANQVLEDLEFLIDECNQVIIDTPKRQESLNDLLESLNDLNENLQPQIESSLEDYSKYIEFSTYQQYLNYIISSFMNDLKSKNYIVKKTYPLSTEETREIMIKNLLNKYKP